MLLGRSHALVKTSFILITNGDFDVNHLPQLGCEFMKVQPERNQVWRRPADCDGVLICHAFFSSIVDANLLIGFLGWF